MIDKHHSPYWKFALVIVTLVLLLPYGCSKRNTGIESKNRMKSKAVVDRNRINSLMVHIESTPPGAQVYGTFSDGKKKTVACVTPCDLEVGYLDETIYEDGSKGRWGHLGGHFAWYFNQDGCHSEAALDVEWPLIPSQEYFKILNAYCVPLQIVFGKEYSNISKVVCFYSFMDKPKKIEVNIDKAMTENDQIVKCSNRFRSTNEYQYETPMSSVMEGKQIYTVYKDCLSGLIIK